MSRTVGASLLLLAGLTSCVVPPSAPTTEGGIVLRWSPLEVPPDAEQVTYELVVFTVEQGLPRDERLTRSYLSATEYEAFGLPPGDYVWSVRARYLRSGRAWVTRWRGSGRLALLPPRGFRAFSVP